MPDKVETIDGFECTSVENETYTALLMTSENAELDITVLPLFTDVLFPKQAIIEIVGETNVSIVLTEGQVKKLAHWLLAQKFEETSLANSNNSEGSGC